MEWLRQAIQKALRQIDRRYQRAHRLQPVGPVLYVGRARYRGPVMQFADDTLLEPGEDVGMLHFNNERFTQIEGGSSRGTALGFARLMIQSLHDLARRARTDPRLCDLAVYHAVSWLPAHGQRIGFICAPYPEGLKKRWMTLHFKLLVWAFAPARDSRSAWPDPHYFWMTRKELLKRFPESDKAPDDIDRRSYRRAGARSG